MDFGNFSVGNRLRVTFNRQERIGYFISMGDGADEGKVRVKLDDDPKEYREIKLEAILGFGDGESEASPFAVPTEDAPATADPAPDAAAGPIYFVWNTRIAMLRLVLKAIPVKVTEKGTITDGKGLAIEAEFGLYKSEDPDITAMLKAHNSYECAQHSRSFREATAEEVGYIVTLEAKGFPRKEILARMTKAINALNN